MQGSVRHLTIGVQVREMSAVRPVSVINFKLSVRTFLVPRVEILKGR